VVVVVVIVPPETTAIIVITKPKMVQQVEMAGAGMGADEQSLKPLLSTGEAASGVPLAAAETDSFSDKEQWRMCDSSSNGSTRRWLVGVGIVFLFLAGLVLLLVVVQQGLLLLSYLSSALSIFLFYVAKNPCACSP